jgi:hypothetical protein
MPQPFRKTAQRFPSDAGIAIGPILFILAILGIIAAYMASGGSGFNTASIADRVTADVATQANLIRTKILECNTIRSTNNNYDGYPCSFTNYATNPGCSTSGATLGAVAVSALSCPGDASGSQSLWTGARPLSLPTPTTGFSAWNYINTNTTGLGGTATGGRCIWIAPTVSNPSSNAGIVQGLTNAANKFTNQTTCSSQATCGATDVIYNPASTSQKFIMWITIPTGTPNSNCLP